MSFSLLCDELCGKASSAATSKVLLPNINPIPNLTAAAAAAAPVSWPDALSN